MPILAVRRHEKNWFMLQQTNRLFPIFTIIYGSLSAQCGLKRATLALFIECVLIWPCSVYWPQCSASFGCLFVTTSADPHHLCLPTYGWIDSLWKLDFFFFFLSQWSRSIYLTLGILQLLVALNSSCPKWVLVFATCTIIQSEIRSGVSSAEASFLYL